jgi:glycyl-tRNA synthetase beta chain
MAELLIELFSEEIPARMQGRAAEDLLRLVTEKLKAAGLAHNSAQAFATPRRLALAVDGLPTEQPEVIDERKGPRVGSPEKAIEGFLKSAGLARLDQCEERDTGKGVFWFAVVKTPGGATAAKLPALIGEAIAVLPWPKSMRFADQPFRWVRPLHRVLAMFDGEKLDGAIELGAGRRLLFSDKASGHRFLRPDEFPVAFFADYQRRLKDSYVLLDPAERRAAIRDGAEAAAKAAGLALRRDDALLEEVTGLVEWPVVLMGRVDDAFMALPPEVLTTTMRTHQKYFALVDDAGRLAPRFLLVSNMETKDKGAAITAGNERVLRARLADAKFFWDQDRKATLESRVPALKDIVFHAKLGTLADKMARVATLAVEIAKHVPGADEAKVRRAARLAKADLTSGMVGEFPELQGVMGRYYALAEGEAPEVAAAIAEHYAPQGPNDSCPTAPVSVALALADKLDILAGFFAIDEKPTGSKDPFALRRAAHGAIRLIVENKLRLPLNPVMSVALRGLPAGSKSSDFDRVPIRQELLDFFADRMKVALKEKGVRHDLIAAVFALGGEDDLVRLLARVEALAKFLAGEDGANLLTAQKRAANILRIEEKKDGKSYAAAPNASLLTLPEERGLQAALAKAASKARDAVGHEDFTGAMAAMAELRRPVDAFFDKVTVNDADPALRANRLKLLSEIRSTLGLVADFSRIEG